MKGTAQPLWAMALCLLFPLPSIATSQTPLPTAGLPGYEQAVRLLGKGSSTLDPADLSTALQVFRACPDHPKDDPGCDYRAAAACLYLTRAYDLEKRKDPAEKALAEGIRCAQKAVTLSPASADTHALLGRLYEAKLAHGDFFTALDIGPKADAENKKALSLDPRNAQVQLALGIQYVMAPPIGGGDVPKGIKALRESLRLDPSMEEAYYWLAKAYRKQNNRALFEQALQDGMKAAPENPLFRNEWESWKIQGK